MPWFIKSKNNEAKTRQREDIWVRCSKCKAHIFKEDWYNNANVCPKCNYHGKLTAYERIGITLDSGTFKELNSTIVAADPLQFVDSKGSYPQKVKDARESTKLNESVVTGTGKINGQNVVLGVMDFRFMGGSLGSATGEKILRAATHAYDHKLPLILFCASGGARMQEGILSLMQMAKTCAGVSRLNERKVPYIAVLTDPTTGGVSASFAMMGDMNIAEPGALIAFAGRRVIEQGIKQKLPDNFQTAEFMLQHGFVDKIVHRTKMKETLANIISFTMNAPTTAEA
jgi:acetyl-CoA carboxylase carboxyl transferase subunit beta